VVENDRIFGAGDRMTVSCQHEHIM